jgi:16S rRNA (guanine527-N7)-methyltransferase
MSSSSSDAVEEAFRYANIGDLPPNAFEGMTAYLELLVRWNARLNLTSVRDPLQIIRRHLVECGFFARRLPGEVQSLMDYGTGAGLPGLVVAICRPDVKVTLAESHGRKAAFLREAIRTLGIACEVCEGRVEAMEASRMFDVVSMRAVERMEQAIPVALHHVRRYLALLTTEELMSKYRGKFSELAWEEPIPLPNAEKAVMVLAVPRGTTAAI